MNTYYVAYEADGRIIQWGHCPPDCLELQAKATGKTIAEGEGHPDTHYVADGVLTERPENPVVIDGNTLKNVPIPSVIVIDSARYDCTEDTVELDLPHAGQYAVTVEAFPYLPKTFGVVV